MSSRSTAYAGRSEITAPYIDKLPTRTEPTSRSELYAHLILALLCDDLSQDFLELFPLRSFLTLPTSLRFGRCRKSRF